jgi:general secretion pathway protein C
LPAKWLSNSSDLPGLATGALENTLRSLARPEVARRLRRLVLALLALWAVFALSQLIWALVPGREASLPEAAAVINPTSVSVTSINSDPVDIGRAQSWHLFGEAGEVPDASLIAQPQPSAATARDGIEDGARETRLALKLRGVVASSEDGLGFAVIEHKSEQDIYAVEDKLPVPGQVVLAKVMARQVVLDNGGTYELLELFEDSTLDTQFLQPPSNARGLASPSEADISAIVGGSASEVARTYRDRLYNNPQSLAEVVTVSAVREGGELRGYRVAPGKQQEKFEQLGFKPGDLVTSVNGISLNDPANTLRLYQTMRSANEAVFDVERDDQAITINVNLANDAAGP